MTLTDTHTHIYGPEFDGDRDEVMARAAEAGVTHMILPACDLQSLEPMRRVRDAYPGRICLAAGLHPTELGDNPAAQVDAIERELTDNRGDYVAVGEIGMDLYWDTSTEALQREIFERQLRIAARLGLPAIIHCREALDATLEVIGRLESQPRMVFHAFSGTVDDVRRIRSVVADPCFGIGGTATFRNCHVSDAFGEIGLDRMVLETDAPYLAPVPKRGRRNEPAYTLHTALFIASAMGIDPELLADVTTANAVRLFGI